MSATGQDSALCDSLVVGQLPDCRRYVRNEIRNFPERGLNEAADAADAAACITQASRLPLEERMAVEVG